MKVTRLLLLLSIAHLGIVHTALAKVPVFEAYAGPRPEHVEAVEPFLRELERLNLGLLTRPAAILNGFGPRAPLPSNDPGITAVKFAQTLERADAEWLRQPPLEVLLPTLQHAVDLGKCNPVFLAKAPNLRDVFGRLLLALALSQKRNGDVQASEETMTEWIRTYPDQVITRSHDGSDAEELYGETLKMLVKRGSGALTVHLDDPSLRLYVNEMIRRPGVPIFGLPLGIYRVLVIDRYSKSRQYLVEVVANHSATLNIEWAVDSSLRITESYAAFEFSTTAALAQSGQAIARLVDSSIGVPAVIILKFSRSGRTQIATAEMYSPKLSEPYRVASVSLPGNAHDAERMAELARALIAQIPSPNVTLTVLPEK